MVTGETSNKDKRSWRKYKSSLKFRLCMVSVCRHESRMHIEKVKENRTQHLKFAHSFQLIVQLEFMLLNVDIV